MSILSDFEDRLARGVEGLFAGAFRSPVQPAEVAKTLARAMDDDRRVGVGKVYAPTVYTVALSAEDREQMGDFAPTLAGELVTFLIGHAAEQGYELLERPTIEFVVHDSLKLGRFRVSAKLPGTAPAEEPIVTSAPIEAEPLDESTMHALATVTVSDLLHDVALKGDRVQVGRLGDCGICLADANVSRTHAEFVHQADGWHLSDLESTNGTYVNGSRIERVRLRDGDTIQMGATELVYHEPRG